MKITTKIKEKIWSQIRNIALGTSAFNFAVGGALVDSESFFLSALCFFVAIVMAVIAYVTNTYAERCALRIRNEKRKAYYSKLAEAE